MKPTLLGLEGMFYTTKGDGEFGFVHCCIGNGVWLLQGASVGGDLEGFETCAAKDMVGWHFYEDEDDWLEILKRIEARWDKDMSDRVHQLKLEKSDG